MAFLEIKLSLGEALLMMSRATQYSSLLSITSPCDVNMFYLCYDYKVFTALFLSFLITHVGYISRQAPEAGDPRSRIIIITIM